MIDGFIGMKRIWITVCLVAVGFLCSFGQYPQAVRPGQTKTVSSGNDTLWILNNRQFDKALVAGKKLAVSDSMIVVLQAKDVKLKQMLAAKDSTIADKDTLYRHYLQKWEGCDKSLETAEIKIVKAGKRTRIWAAVAGVLGIVIGFLIGS